MTTTIKAYCETHGIRMMAEWAGTNPNINPDDWAKGASHWRCTFRKGRKQFTTYFSMGSAHTGEPAATDVLSCLADDAAGFENASGFEDWAGEYGYDTDSRKAERTFRTIDRQAQRLKAFLGDDAYQALLWETERE